MSQIDQEATTDSDTDSRFTPGTVDNPFLYDADIATKQKFLLTIMFVAGKNATTQQKKVDAFIDCVKRDIGDIPVSTMGVFAAIHAAVPTTTLDTQVEQWLQEVKVGQYSRLTAAIKSACVRLAVGTLNLTYPTRQALSNTVGVGLKSASMFLLYTVPGWRGAVLDTHILKFIRDTLGEEVPLATPAKVADYTRIEDIYLKWADKQKKSLSELDFEIWSSYRKK